MSGISTGAPDDGSWHRATHRKGRKDRRKHLKTRYVLAASGLVLTSLGFWALVELKGRAQALLSALIVIGLVLLLASILHFKKREITLELVLAVAGAITLPYALWNVGGQGSPVTTASCTNGGFAHQRVPTQWIPYMTDNNSRFSTSGGVHALAYPDLRWAGYFLPLPDKLCSYRVSFFAREVGPVSNPMPGTGWGYALGACDKTAPTAPRGFSLQYAFYEQAKMETAGFLEVVHLPRANTFPNGVGQGSPYPLDYNWHEWTLAVASNQVQVYLDDDYKVAQENLTGPGLPNNCVSSGVFIRVWGGAAQFRDLSIIAA